MLLLQSDLCFIKRNMETETLLDAHKYTRGGCHPQVLERHRRKQTCRDLALELLASRTVRNKCMLFQTSRLRYFIIQKPQPTHTTVNLILKTHFYLKFKAFPSMVFMKQKMTNNIYYTDNACLNLGVHVQYSRDTFQK